MIHFDQIELGDLKLELSAGRRFNANEIRGEHIDMIAELIAERTNGECFTVVYNRGSLDPSRIGMLVSMSNRHYYQVRLDRATWTLIGAVLDLLITKGISVTTLAAIGLAGQVASRIPLQNGAVCHFLECRVNGPLLVEQLVERLRGRSCPYVDFDCMFNDAGTCTVSEAEVRASISKLSQQGLVGVSTRLVFVR